VVDRRAERPAIAVAGLEKRFRIARPRATSGAGRWAPRRSESLEVLRGVSFEVRQGELFGLMGRNGSGKSTLLKIISGVYPADVGGIEINGRLAPALQLGVGFSPELSAAENASITGVMLGLSRREARSRVESILEFADLRGFSDTRLKDLSHGMRMRLAFAALIETDPSILLVDEILAVGDRAFQEKCTEAFAAFRARGRTVVLVSHATGLIERICDRAMLLEAGKVDLIGDPVAVTARYIEINVGDGGSEAETIDDGDRRRAAIRISDPSLTASTGLDLAGAGADDEIRIEATLEALSAVDTPGLRIEIHNERGGRVFLSPGIPLARLAAGDRTRVQAWVENRLHPGDYSLSVSVVRPGRRGNEVPASPVTRLPLRIPGGTRSGGGAVALRHGATLQRSAEAVEVMVG